MKKTLIIILAIAMMAFAFTGCAKTEEPAATETPATETPATETPAEEVDVVTTASIVDNGEALVKALSAEGAWIAATLKDIELSEDLVIDGELMKGDAVARKLALYTQDENRNITAQFTLTAPKMIVKSPMFKLTGGTFKGDVYVEAEGFILDKSATIDGNLYFASQKNLDTFTMTDSAVVTGMIQVDGVDVVTTASLVIDANDLVKGLSAEGTWIVAAYNNMVLSQEIIVDGEFISKEKIARKLALYTQDEERNIISQFTLKAPKMTVKSENFKIQGGTFIGDVYVEANGFQLAKATTLKGNIFFAKQEYMDSFIMDESAVLEGEKSVQ
ncbi:MULTISPECIES: polymer-forming cytoskeletal protein [unclassified Fusibacter]|uniref:polymer-forming cytoskeletal protein n=1 Tax=unclassified Fusibacter TaxID=2624464 RepID=UPI001011E839|nr:MULTISPECIES: polymer-forming cytoskeletal protein [unclassified Fusibacter]MCK8059696.1 polymer-forming cytoskeletal protein [Fusibacter sp. A2]NPE21497.1 hypothetical protein [Fusibacter sp. A1]RXV61907.1 polymer-forming cytoskeletal protein [Fusibacter sp. A1]